VSLFQLYALYKRLSTKITSNVMHGAESSLRNASTKTPKKMFKDEVNELRSHFPGNFIISAKMPMETAEANMEHSMIM
jgi:hypothetical protein